MQFTLKVIGNMIMSLEPTGEEQEKFRDNFKLISSSFASLPFKIPGTAFHRGIKVSSIEPQSSFTVLISLNLWERWTKIELYTLTSSYYCFFKFRRVVGIFLKFSMINYCIFSQARDRMYSMLDSIISKRRNGDGFQQDFLESLIMKHSKARRGEEEDDYKDKDKLTDQQLKDNILTLLVAGHDTTTAALTWLIKFLGENPLVLERLRVIMLFCHLFYSTDFQFLLKICYWYYQILQNCLNSQDEHKRIQASRNGGSNLTWSSVNDMPYTAKVSKTCMIDHRVLLSMNIYRQSLLLSFITSYNQSYNLSNNQSPLLLN